MTSYEQPVFWRPDADTGTLILTGLPDFLEGSAAPFTSFPAETGTTIRAAEGRYLRFGPVAQSLPILDMADKADKDDETSRAILIPFDEYLMDRVETVIRLYRLMKGLQPQDGRLTPGQRLRLRHMLQAVDGDDHGASGPEIAEVVFGRTRDRGRAWHESTFRFKVSRLIRDGRTMIAHGYRFLLRPKRRR